MEIKIVGYNPIYKKDFIRLNKAWLEEFFYVEPHDIETFENVEEDIINNGGEIFFCLVNNEVVGTVAMIKTDAMTFELAKLAIDKTYQGLHLSSRLMEACIELARSKKALKIFLVSNTSLKPALGLYKRFNFIEVPLDETDYDRANIQMELIL